MHQRTEENGKGLETVVRSQEEDCLEEPQRISKPTVLRSQERLVAMILHYTEYKKTIVSWAKWCVPVIQATCERLKLGIT